MGFIKANTFDTGRDEYYELSTFNYNKFTKVEITTKSVSIDDFYVVNLSSALVPRIKTMKFDCYGIWEGNNLKINFLGFNDKQYDLTEKMSQERKEEITLLGGTKLNRNVNHPRYMLIN